MALYNANSSSNYREYASNAAFDISTAITVSCWVKSNLTTQNGSSAIVTRGVLGNSEWSLSCTTPGANAKFRFALKNSGGTQANAVDTVDWTSGTWYQLVGRWDGTNIKLYRDGAEVGTAALSGSCGSPATAIRLFMRTNGGNNFDCHVSELGIWNVALDTAEISALAAGIDPILIRPSAWIIVDHLTTKDTKDIIRGLGADTGTLTSPANPRTFKRPISIIGKGSGGASPDVTVAITGVAGTGAVGTVIPSTTVPVTGAAATGAAGTVAPSTALPITGVAGTGAAGTVTPSTSVAITGVASTGSAGTVTPSTTVGLTGVAGTGTVGSVSVSSGFGASLSGVAATGTVGSVGAAVTVAITGVGATGAVGSVAVSGGDGAVVVATVSGLASGILAQFEANIATLTGMASLDGTLRPAGHRFILEREPDGELDGRYFLDMESLTPYRRDWGVAEHWWEGIIVVRHAYYRGGGDLAGGDRQSVMRNASDDAMRIGDVCEKPENYASPTTGINEIRYQGTTRAHHGPRGEIWETRFWCRWRAAAFTS